MVSTFERIVVAVPGLAECTARYAQLLGIEALPAASAEPRKAWFPLANTVIELVESTVQCPRISSLVLGAAEAGSVRGSIANSRGLDIQLDNAGLNRALREQHEGLAEAALSVDHLVLRTNDAEDCIDLFSRQLGVRLALDRSVPEWGGRMLFFRAGKMTLEVIEPVRDKPATDHFWGIAYQCRDLEQTARELKGRGVKLSDIRAGRKPGSLVATLKSHCLDIPTLLLQH